VIPTVHNFIFSTFFSKEINIKAARSNNIHSAAGLVWHDLSCSSMVPTKCAAAGLDPSQIAPELGLPIVECTIDMNHQDSAM